MQPRPSKGRDTLLSRDKQPIVGGAGNLLEDFVFMSDLIADICCDSISQLLQQRMEGLGLSKCHLLDVDEMLGRAALHDVGRQSERRPHKAQHGRRVAHFLPQDGQGLPYVRHGFFRNEGPERGTWKRLQSGSLAAAARNSNFENAVDHPSLQGKGLSDCCCKSSSVQRVCKSMKQGVAQVARRRPW